ncbi:GNAT family protein [Microbacterium sp.]|uniref:GNAT family N-acetyltransferase n=1 Tax=Microbacterium sp. TaxID=51671 RepID=UPI001ACE26AF|nr:GNAT family protein [Microbacterium sp.]MBN9156889.1 GNAT family N-acetyltransferase [Microbacterium sp.]MBS1900421.1 GNAT family N-acetyltransferase [Actinomycetota bacterium]
MSSRSAVTLRARTDADLDALYLIASDLDTWEERNPGRPAARTREAWQARMVERDTDPAYSLNFVIDVDGEAVGNVGLFEVDELARHAEVGIALIPSARGKGIGTEAMRRMLEFAFVRGNLRRVHLEVIASNAAAIRSYEKAGFVVEGRQREHAWVRGQYEDIVRMGILRSEWSGAPAA